MSDGSDEAWEPESDDVGDNDSVPAVTPRHSKRQREPCDYAKEHSDNFFANQKGYTDFHRTRKGGDRRPNAVKKVWFVRIMCAQNVVHNKVPT